MSKVYDFTFGLNFGYFDDFNSLYKGISLDTDEESIDLFEYKYNGLYGANPYISHIDVSDGIAKPSKIFRDNKLDKKNNIPIINLSFNPLNSQEFTTKYLDSVKKELKDHLNKFVKILISGHGQSINSIGTGTDKLNSGYITIKEISEVLKFLIDDYSENISYLKLCLVACRASRVGTPKYLYNEIKKLSLPFPFCVVGYDEKINMCNALNARHDMSIEKFSTFYSNDFEGRRVFRQKFKSELDNIINSFKSKLQFLSHMYSETLIVQKGRVTLRTIDILCSKLVDAIEYAQLDNSKKRYYQNINIIPKTQYSLTSEEIFLSKKLYDRLIRFKNDFSVKADKYYQSVQKSTAVQTELKKDRSSYFTGYVMN